MPFLRLRFHIRAIAVLLRVEGRGNSAPGVAKWAIKVCDEILSLDMPPRRPALVGVTIRDRSGVPRPVKQARVMGFRLIVDLERAAMNSGIPMGMRFYSSACVHSNGVRVSPFSDCRAVFMIWESDTSIRGRPMGLKLKRRPIIPRATPRGGIHSGGR